MRPNELQQQQQAGETTRLLAHSQHQDNMSETSEATTATTATSRSSLDNREELRDIAVVLGIANAEDVLQERFRVDRRKLELMLLGDLNAGETAESFFHKVMELTNTYVTWPSRLKIGAKSKKDPHIKVSGRPESIRAAKEKIIQLLDTRSNRVTMKLDVSYTDHSHIIGKGGLTIKKVMEETGCHIHFPDSNRSNHQEKSNQVSIAGDMQGVERARARVRNLTPLIFSFELPVMGNTVQCVGNASPFSTSPYVIKVQEQYNVQVMFRTRPKLHATLVVVKGCEWEVTQVKEATLLLIQHMCENLANQIQVQMSMEISPQHHSTVLGKQSNNLKAIMQRTATQIMFPDAGDPNIPSLKKSNVTITGSINNVYLARQQLMGSLPLVLMFDLPEDSVSSVNTDNVSRLMQTLDVFINVRHKPKQSTLSIVVKGIERNAGNVYEARRQLLGLNEHKVVADIPPTYHVPNSTSFILQGSCTPVGINENLGNNNLNMPLPTSYCNLTPPPGGFASNNNSLPFPPHWAMTTIPPSLFSPLSLHHSHLTSAYTYSPQLNHMMSSQQQLHHAVSNANKGMMNHHVHSNNNNNNGLNNTLNGSTLSNTRGGLFESKDSAYSSISSVTSSLSSPAMSPRNASPIDPSSTSEINANISSVLSDLSISNSTRNLNHEKKSDINQLSDYSSVHFDYEQKKLLAMKAMQSKTDSNEFRVPTAVWSGYGFSQTSPTIPTISESKSQNSSIHQTSDLWNESSSIPKPGYGGKDESVNHKISGLNSNYMEQTPNYILKKITSSHFNNLENMLVNVGLEKYIRLFTSHEVDLSTFSSLTDKDLVEIGITAWGARRKIMLLISELNKRSSPFSGSAAPGAERKIASTTSTSSATSPPPRKSSLENTTW